MRPLSLSEVAAWSGGVLSGGMRSGSDRAIVAVDTDSRRVRRDALFVALRGERHDGHAHAADAIDQGASALLVSRRLDVDAPQVVCDDTEVALGRLAAGLARTRHTKIVAITGSNGKTTVKTFTRAILAHAAGGEAAHAATASREGVESNTADATQGTASAVYANPGNRNNQIGLPLAVLEQPEDAAIGIYEMGAGQPGDIAYLTDVVRPEVALVNNIAPAHLERMGSLLGIARTKGAIYTALAPGGTAVLNADDAFATWFEAQLERIGSDARLLRFGIETTAEVSAESIVCERDRSRFVLVTPHGKAPVCVPHPGRHNVANALAASALALAAGASLHAIVEGLAQAPSVAGRLVRHQLPSGALLFDDSYNANPGSVDAAIATLAASGARSWLVLGDMKELGADEAQLHAEIGQRAREAGIAHLFTVGPLSAAASRAFGAGAQHFGSQDELAGALRAGLSSGDVCLVKGSRSSAMDAVVAALLARNGAPDGEGAGRAA